MYKTNFRVVQLMYRPLLCFQQSVANLVVGVQTCRLNHYRRFQIGTVIFHAHALSLNSQYPTLLKAQGCYLDLYTSYGVDNMYDKFQRCTVDVQVATLILNNPRTNPVLCTQAKSYGV